MSTCMWHEWNGDPNSRPMIRWLSDKPQSTWAWVAGRLNWEYSEPEMICMLSHPDCDKAVAFSAFQLSGASELFHPGAIYPGGDRLQNWHNAFEIELLILHRWAFGAYHDAGWRVEIEPHWPDEVRELRALHAQFGDQYPETPLPGDLLDYQPGPNPIVLPPEHDPYQTAEVWDLFEQLGTMFGTRPSG